MTVHSAPEGMFLELVEVHGLIRNILGSADTQVAHWPTYYRLYLEVDGIAGAMHGIADWLDTPFAGFGAQADAGRIEWANGSFSRIEKHYRAIVDLLAHLQRWSLAVLGGVAAAGIVREHCAPKSAWYQEWQEGYCAGRTSSDGLMLERTVYLLDPDPIHRVYDLEEKKLVRQQRFDLSTDATRLALAGAAGHAIKVVRDTGAVMGDYLVRHCRSVSELLHPSIA